MSDQALLLVDDERPILNALKRVLRKEPYTLLVAESGEDALDVIETARVQVVVSDFRMPGMSGVDLLRQVKHRWPNTVRVVLSGYADGHIIMDSINVGEVFRFLPKPWNDDELIVTIRQCFDQHRLITENERLIGQVRSQNEELREMNVLLEEAVDQRTRSLQLSQEILEKLPMPVLGVSRDGTIVFVNAAVRDLFAADARMPLGAHLSDIVPGSLVETVERGLQGRDAQAPIPCFIEQTDFRVHLRMLNEGGDLRGCTLVLEPRYDDEYNHTIKADSAAC